MMPRVIAVFCLLLLAACEPASKAPLSPNILVGTESLHVTNKVEEIARITDIDGKVIITEIEEVDSGRVTVWEDYRGLLRVAALLPNGDTSVRYELDFDQTELEQLFPLKVGKKVTFRGTLRIITQSRSFDTWINIKVTGEKTIKVENKKHKVFVVEVFQEFSGDVDGEFQEKLYYDPKISMVLQRITKQEGRETISEVKSIKMPSEATTPSRLRQRRSGTVMI
jgi:uncharacterized lipoprotein YbaY